MNERLKSIKGIIPPMITPFEKDGKMYEQGVRNLVRFLNGKVDGFFICGSYGAGPMMTVAERKRVAEIVVEEVGGKAPIIVHVGTINPSDAEELVVHANTLPVDAIASVPPCYFAYEEEDVARFYKGLVDKSHLPVMAYNNPKTSGFSMTPKFLKQLAAAGLAGMKDSSHDIAFFYTVMHETKEYDFLCLEGSIAMGLPSLVAGSPAIISGLANVFPEIETTLLKAAQNNEWDKAIEIQQHIDSIKRCTRVGSPIPVTHAMLKMRGVDAGYAHAPYVELDAEKYKKLENDLKAFKLL